VGAIHQDVLVDPTGASRVRSDNGMDIAWQSSLDLLHVLKNARPRPVEISPILEDDEDIGITEHCLRADGFDVRSCQQFRHDGIGDLIFNKARRLAGPGSVNDNLNVGDMVSSIQEIPLAKIRESRTNPRRFFDEVKLAELADNIKQHGVLQPILLRPLPGWIAREIHLDLSNAPFDPQDEKLLPAAGACSRCPKQTGSNPLLFPEIPRRASICTDRECYRAKVEALVQIQAKPLEEKGEKPLRVSQAPSWQANGHAKDVLFEGQYRKAKAKGECPNTKAAVLIDGKGAGSIFYLCQTEKCEVHNRVTRYQPTPQEQAQRKKEALAERVEKLSRVRILEAIRKKLPDALSRPDLEMVALDYFRRLGHDNHRRLSKLYAWEEKKSKTSWGAQTVDYEKIAAASVQAMKTADVNRFLVMCALVSDLYCPGYNPRQSLAKDANLARTAARYKIAAEKASATVRAELSKKTNGHRSERKANTRFGRTAHSKGPIKNGRK
jgi:ParB-like nuclease domain